MEPNRMTQLIRKRIAQTEEGEHSSPIFLTSSFTFDSAEEMRAAFADETEDNIYSRFSNPNSQELVDRMCILEGAEDGFATASGMSAIFSTIMALLKQGDHIISCNAIFGSTHTVFTKFLPKFGIEYTYVPASDLNAWEAAIRHNTKIIFLETPTNPGLEIIDLEMVNSIAKKNGIILVVDNCFATPLGQRPIEFGADIVIHSATKWLDGQGRTLGGVVLGKSKFIYDIYLFCRSTGPALSPFNAWILSRSLETLEVRMQRHVENAFYLAQKLEGHEKIAWLKYPFLLSHPQYKIATKQMKNGGGMFCFELKEGLEGGRRFLDRLQILSRTANLGDTRTIASHPASTTHGKLSNDERLNVGITPGMIRISAGLENKDDILNDILQALG